MREERERVKAEIMARSDEIFERYMAGESMKRIAESMPFKIAAWRLRDILLDDPDTRESYANIHIHRSHNLVDAAVDYANEAARLGDAAGFRVAIDANLKVASKINSRDYGEKSKVELTGKDGGPVKMVALTDDQLMEIASRGAVKGVNGA